MYSCHRARSLPPRIMMQPAHAVQRLLQPACRAAWACQPFNSAAASFSTSSCSTNSSSNSGQLKWVFLGPPGVGKGTYASRIAAALNVPHIAAGDLVRAEIKSGSALGQQVRQLGPTGCKMHDTQSNTFSLDDVRSLLLQSC